MEQHKKDVVQCQKLNSNDVYFPVILIVNSRFQSSLNQTFEPAVLEHNNYINCDLLTLNLMSKTTILELFGMIS